MRFGGVGEGVRRPKSRIKKEDERFEEMQSILDAHFLEIERWKKRFAEDKDFHKVVVELVNKKLSM